MKSLLLLLMVPLTSTAADLSQVSSPELCVQFATTLLTGQPTEVGTMEDFAHELTARQVECHDGYLKVAELRLDRRNEQSRLATQLEMQQAQIAADSSAQRRQALFDLGTQILNQPGPASPAMAPIQPPQRTNCRMMGQNLNCTTW